MDFLKSNLLTSTTVPASSKMDGKAFIAAAVKGQIALVEQYAATMPIEIIQRAYDKVKIANSRPDAEGELDDIVDLLESIIDDVENDSDYD